MAVSPPEYHNKAFSKLAALYTCLKAPSLIYTRNARSAELLSNIDIPILWEEHHSLDRESPYRKLLDVNSGANEYCAYISELFANYSRYRTLSFSAFQEYESRLNWTAGETAIKHLSSIV